MANWCSNSIAFEGSKKALQQIGQMFETLHHKECTEEKGQLPDFIQADEGYMFSIYWEEDISHVYYETKWSPNIEVMRQIAAHFGVTYEHNYDELSCSIYGQAVYRDGILTDTYVDVKDFDLFHMNEDECSWTFEGKKYESDYEILEILLERKQKILSLSNIKK